MGGVTQASSLAGDAVKLLRPGLCAMVALSGVAGAMLPPSPAGWRSTVLLACGVFLLACGATVLNQVQERRTDALMRRTRLRPLACGRMKPATGLALAIVLAIGGSILLGHFGLPAILLGAGALACYNGLYTPLKRRTSLALLPGALCGAIPPLIGRVATDGPSLDLRILLLASLLFLWQIPHFCALASRHHADFRRSGLCTPPAHRGIVLVWILALGATTMQAAAFGLLQTSATAPLLLLLFFWLLPPALRTLEKNSRPLAMRLQLFLAVLLTSIIFDGIVLL